jgi:hypothetical protein
MAAKKKLEDLLFGIGREMRDYLQFNPPLAGIKKIQEAYRASASDLASCKARIPGLETAADEIYGKQLVVRGTENLKLVDDDFAAACAGDLKELKETLKKLGHTKISVRIHADAVAEFRELHQAAVGVYCEALAQEYRDSAKAKEDEARGKEEEAARLTKESKALAFEATQFTADPLPSEVVDRLEGEGVAVNLD